MTMIDRIWNKWEQNVLDRIGGERYKDAKRNIATFMLFWFLLYAVIFLALYIKALI